MTKPMIGHLLNRQNYVEGVRGLAYDYVFARNGVFLEAENNFIKARIRVVETEIRGLDPTTESIELKHGLMPSYLLAMVVNHMRRDFNREMYAAIIWTGEMYELRHPQQEQFSALVSYEPVPNTVLDCHSHGRLGAHFSHTDDTDDQGFRISGVVGRLDQARAELEMRLGVYGYHAPVSFLEVFSGDMPLGLAAAPRDL